MIPRRNVHQGRRDRLNVGRKTVTLTGGEHRDRPVQVGPIIIFFETNPALKFDRKKSARHAARYRARQRRCASSPASRAT